MTDIPAELAAEFERPAQVASGVILRVNDGVVEMAFLDEETAKTFRWDLADDTDVAQARLGMAWSTSPSFTFDARGLAMMIRHVQALSLVVDVEELERQAFDL